MQKRMMFLKCKTCPYALGQIKCIVSPCRECITAKRKTHPFSEFGVAKKQGNLDKN